MPPPGPGAQPRSGPLGIRVAPLAGLTERAMARLARRPLDALVEDFRTRPRLSPLRVPGVDRVFNTLEFFVHHEDIRRAQPAWSPRALDDDARDALWDAISTPGKLMVRPAGVPVTVRRTDTGATAVLRGGDDPVVARRAPRRGRALPLRPGPAPGPGPSRGRRTPYAVCGTPRSAPSAPGARPRRARP